MELTVGILWWIVYNRITNMISLQIWDFPSYIMLMNTFSSQSLSMNLLKVKVESLFNWFLSVIYSITCSECYVIDTIYCHAGSQTNPILVFLFWHNDLGRKTTYSFLYDIYVNSYIGLLIKIAMINCFDKM